MMDIPLKVKKITVLLTDRIDIIEFALDGPSAFPEMKYPPVLKMSARKDYGAEWVNKIFLDVKPDEIINCRTR